MSSWKRRACNSENVCPTPEKKSVDRRDSHCQGLLSIFVSTCTIITFFQFLSIFHPLILFLGKTKSVSLQCKIDTEQAGKYSLLHPRPLSRLRNERQRREAVFAGYLRRSVLVLWWWWLPNIPFVNFDGVTLNLFISISFVNENVAVVVADST